MKSALPRTSRQKDTISKDLLSEIVGMSVTWGVAIIKVILKGINQIKSLTTYSEHMDIILLVVSAVSVTFLN